MDDLAAKKIKTSFESCSARTIFQTSVQLPIRPHPPGQEQR
jgi:hypothetical protein